MASSIRSFIAVEFTKETTRDLARLISPLMQKWPEYRWVEPENLHLTLNFLGDVPDQKIPRVCEIVRETMAGHSRFKFAFSELGAFPKALRPRILWVGVADGKSQLTKIYYDIADQLNELRLDRDRKAFRPHVTLGRIRDRQRWPDSVIEHLQTGSSLQLGTVDVNEVVLFSSHQENTGPIYTVMDRAPLN